MLLFLEDRTGERLEAVAMFSSNPAMMMNKIKTLWAGGEGLGVLSGMTIQ